MRHFILLRHFMDGRIERSDWTGEEARLRPGAYFPDPDVESEWIVTKRLTPLRVNVGLYS
jgi:hypothetical protein